MAADPFKVTLDEKQERAVLIYAERAHELLMNQFSIRANLEQIDRLYQRENNWNDSNVRARLANRMGDAKRMADPTIPIVMPQVEASLGYLTNVFLTGYPIFGVAADPLNEDTALQFETIIGENAITAGWARELMMAFRDGLKYNLCAVECEWQQKNVWTIDPTIDVTRTTGTPKKTLWNGNVLTRWDLYNSFFDPRVHPARIHTDAEYAGRIDIMSRVAMKKFFNDQFGNIPVKTVERALASSPPATGVMATSMSPFAYYLPLINPFATLRRQNLQTFDWMAWAGGFKEGDNAGIRYSNVYEVTKLYARIIPRDFGLEVPERNTPQVWKFIIVNGNVVVVAERQTNVHDWIPVFFGQPLEDGLDYQTKSFASNVGDMQNIGSAMISGYMASKRRLVGDRVAYDPSRIRKEDIESTNPVAKIPVRPSAYGKPVSDAFAQFPFHDEQTESLLKGSQLMMSFADLINGQNPAQRGQFVKGNKTTSEFDDTMGHGNDRNQMMAISLENQIFTPMKECIKLNILQYQPPTTLYNRTQQQQVAVQPTDLRKQAVLFKVSDGLIPKDKQMSTEELIAAVQAFGSNPQLGAQYNQGPAFTYIMKLRGADLGPFEKSPLQLQYEQQVAAWQQVAQVAAKAGTQIPPQPVPSPELQQELQQKQQTGGTNPDKKVAALQSTQGGGGAGAQQ